MLRDFVDYLLSGKLADLAIAVILAVAFGELITSLVSNVMAPLFGLFGSPDGLSGLSVGIGGAEVKYGNFLTDLIGFLMIAVVVYLGVVRPLQAVRAKALGPVPDTTICHDCLSTIPSKANRCAFCTSMQDQSAADTDDEDELPAMSDAAVTPTDSVSPR